METLSTSVKERRRLEVPSRVKSQEMSLVKATELLGMSYRQAIRQKRGTFLSARYTKNSLTFRPPADKLSVGVC